MKNRQKKIFIIQEDFIKEVMILKYSILVYVQTRNGEMHRLSGEYTELKSKEKIKYLENLEQNHFDEIERILFKLDNILCEHAQNDK